MSSKKAQNSRGRPNFAWKAHACFKYEARHRPLAQFFQKHNLLVVPACLSRLLSPCDLYSVQIHRCYDRVPADIHRRTSPATSPALLPTQWWRRRVARLPPDGARVCANVVSHEVLAGIAPSSRWRARRAGGYISTYSAKHTTMDQPTRADFDG